MVTRVFFHSDCRRDPNGFEQDRPMILLSHATPSHELRFHCSVAPMFLVFLEPVEALQLLRKRAYVFAEDVLCGPHDHAVHVKK